MKIKIVSGGTPLNTRIENADTGEALDNVRGVTWHCKIGESKATVTLELINVAVTVIGDTEK